MQAPHAISSTVVCVYVYILLCLCACVCICALLCVCCVCICALMCVYANMRSCVRVLHVFMQVSVHVHSSTSLQNV